MGQVLVRAGDQLKVVVAIEHERDNVYCGECGVCVPRKCRMKTTDLARRGIPAGPCAEAAKQILQKAHAAKHSMAAVLDDLGRVAASPSAFLDNAVYAGLAQRLLDHSAAGKPYTPRESYAPYWIWGDNLEATAVQQLKNACSLPVVSGALMPDAHVGYGLPIGGVLATRDAVIPYAVGVDIACRMKMTILDLAVHAADTDRARLTRAIERETRFGMRRR
jgi:tRNA-splicing ligase RtcB